MAHGLRGIEKSWLVPRELAPIEDERCAPARCDHEGDKIVDTVLAIGEHVRQLSGHGDGVQGGCSDVPKGLGEGRIELGSVLEGGAGDLRNLEDAPVFEARALDIGAA